MLSLQALTSIRATGQIDGVGLVPSVSGSLGGTSGTGPLSVPLEGPAEGSAEASEAVTGSDVEVHEMDGMVPVILDSFIGLLADVGAVVGVIAEQGRTRDEIHVTTFADQLTPEVREAVYEAERKMIESVPDRTFDFHLREPVVEDGERKVPAAQYALLLWQRECRP
jgi:hypothetical protein